MKVVIWGVTPLGKYLVNNMVHNNVSVKALAFVDNNKKLQNTFVDNIPVISYEKLIEEQDITKLTVLLAIRNSRHIFQVLKQIENSLLINIGIVKYSVMLFGLTIDPYDQDKNIIWNVWKGRKYPIIPRIEVNLIDACNLKCKGCSHFSSIYEKDSLYLLADYKRDLLQLKKVGQMLRLRLLGGEPLLLDNLNEYVVESREILPEADIEIVTNGLLIPEINERILLAIKSNDVYITISPYLPTIKKKEQIAKRLDEYNIVWRYGGEKEISHFSRNLTLQDTHDEEKSSAVCQAGMCTFLRKGKIYKCPYDGLINDFYDYFGLRKEHVSGTDIYQNENIIYEKLVDYALNPVEMCKYCAEKLEYIPWEIKNNPSLQDWLYKENQIEGVRE